VPVQGWHQRRGNKNREEGKEEGRGAKYGWRKIGQHEGNEPWEDLGGRDYDNKRERVTYKRNGQTESKELRRRMAGKAGESK